MRQMMPAQVRRSAQVPRHDDGPSLTVAEPEGVRLVVQTAVT